MYMPTQWRPRIAVFTNTIGHSGIMQRKWYKKISWNIIKNNNSLCAIDPKKMWSEIKRLVSSKRTPNVINCDIFLIDRLNRHFVNITKNHNRNFINEPGDFFMGRPKSFYVFKFKHISHMDIESYFNSLTNKGSKDILDIKLIKLPCPIISKSLASVANLSFGNGIVHGDWKTTRVTPIYKNEEEIDDENSFRPISVISHIAKMVESLISTQVVDYLESHKFISIDQSAYLKRHSIQRSLHRAIDDWLEQITDNPLTGACLLDVSICFDSINHEMFQKS